MQKLSIYMETKVLNDSDDKILRMAELAIERPELEEVVSRDSANDGSGEPTAMYVLYLFAYALHVHKGKLLVDNEWIGFVRIMRTAFRKETIREYWKTIEPENWFDPEFRTSLIMK